MSAKSGKGVATQGGRSEVFGKPGPGVMGLQEANYDKLRPEGTPPVGTAMEPDDILIGRMSVERGRDEFQPDAGTAPEERRRDNSVAVRDERGIVQSVRTVVLEGGAAVAKEVLLRQQCLNEVGDK